MSQVGQAENSYQVTGGERIFSRDEFLEMASKD
jgi:hypothetical protein